MEIEPEHLGGLIALALVAGVAMGWWLAAKINYASGYFRGWLKGHTEGLTRQWGEKIDGLDDDVTRGRNGASANGS